MGPITLQPTLAEVLAVAARQHGVVTGAQLVARGLSRDGIEHRARRGRLFRVHRNVYAIGSPILTREGRWMAAVLACGAGAALSHESAAALWRIRDRERESIEVSVPPRVVRRHDGIRAHRRALTAVDLSRHRSIPVTAPACTLIDLAARLDEGELERAISEADKLGLTDPDRLLPLLEKLPRRPGVAILRNTLTRHTFRLTDSELERGFIPLAVAAGLPVPRTRQIVNGHRVDFWWPAFRLVVETDGLTYHRTPAQQAADRRRDQAHTAAGLTQLRFTHWQVRFDPQHVVETLARVARRLAPAA
jgi:very-short-patch-repair endonuclease